MPGVVRVPQRDAKAWRDALLPHERREAWIAGGVIREVAKRLVLEGDADLKARFLEAVASAPPAVLAQAFRQAAAPLVNDNLIAMVAELEQACRDG
jgi:hypothetical protein